MRVICYPMANKPKSQEICRAFADGCGGVIGTGTLGDAAAFFYGVNESNEAVWNEVRRSRREFFYCDNSYFDESRGTYFRITRNAIQHSGRGESNGARFRSLGIEVRPWRIAGHHIVVCEQSRPFMWRIARTTYPWTEVTVSAIRSITDRPLRLRAWSADKPALARTLHEDMVDAHCLVTWTSTVGIQAILAGVPAICTGSCAASPMAGSSLDDLWAPPMPDGREQWASVLADQQWTLAEMRNGKALAHIAAGEAS